MENPILKLGPGGDYVRNMDNDGWNETSDQVTVHPADDVATEFHSSTTCASTVEVEGHLQGRLRLEDLDPEIRAAVELAMEVHKEDQEQLRTEAEPLMEKLPRVCVTSVSASTQPDLLQPDEQLYFELPERKPVEVHVNRDLLRIYRPVAIESEGQEVNDHVELNTEAIADFKDHPRLAFAAGLFADDARVGRRDGRQQSDHLRARRGLNQKRRLKARRQQSSLFGAHG